MHYTNDNTYHSSNNSFEKFYSLGYMESKGKAFEEVEIDFENSLLRITKPSSIENSLKSESPTL